MSKARMKGVVLICALCLAGVASAGDLTAGAGPGTSVNTTHDYVPCDTGWDITGENSSPLYVWMDPTAGAWEKTLSLPAAAVPERLVLLEYLQVKGNAWRDWHEEIVTPGWTWGSVWDCDIWLEDGAGGFITPPGLTTTISPCGKVVSFEFDAVPVGSDLLIEKWLIREPDVQPGSAIIVREYPTPEPATLALLSMGGALVPRRRRRK